MYFINVTQPWSLLISLCGILGLLYLGKVCKNSKLNLIPLAAYLIILVTHAIQFLTLSVQDAEIAILLGRCLLVDFIMILLTYIIYLWVDDIETKAKNKKSINNCIEWFWKKV
ncbi:MAG: hypothetical protein HFJ53_07250 [Clostridia bacterium]|jgi:hypothetical protein|nr:hypothetical protein [Clostridia bacterium]